MKQAARKILVFCVCSVAALSVMVNALSLAFVSWQFNPFLSMGTAIENQDMLRAYSKVAVIPVDIVSRLMSKAMPMRMITKKAVPPAQGDKRKSKSPFSDLSFASFIPADKYSRIHPAVHQQDLIENNTLFSAGCEPSAASIPAERWQFALFIFMLAYIIKLRRISLPAPNVLTSLYLKNPILVFSRIGLFFWRV